MSDRPDVVILMTDEERAVPPYESADVLAWRDRTLRWPPLVRRARRELRPALHRLAGLRAQPPDDLHRAVSGPARRHPDRRHRQAADDSRLRWLRQGEVPTLGNWFRAAGYDTHYDGKWHISHADLDDPATGRSLATNDDDGVVDPAAVRRYLDADPLGAVRLLRLGRPGAARCGYVQQPVFVATRWSPTGSSRGSRTATPAAAPATRPRCARSCWWPASSTRTTSCCSRPGSAAARWQPSPRGSAARARGAHRRRGSADQAGRADRVPRGLLLRLRSGAGDQPRATSATRSSTATCTTGCTPRWTDRSTGSAAPSPRAGPTTPCWCARPITAICSARTAGCTRSGSTCTTRPPGCRSSSPASATGATQPRDGHGADVARRPGADAAGRGRYRRGRRRRRAGRVVLRSAPAAGPRPDAGRRRRRRPTRTAPST